MLRVHFLNVGHGDCTIIEHPSGRLTMIDINNSQNYDPDTMNEMIEERRQRRVMADALSGLGAHSGLLSGTGAASLLDAYSEAYAAAKEEITDPVEFMHRHYRGRQLFRFILTHPDLDHMRGIKRLYDEVGFTNFWDTGHSKGAPDYKNNSDRVDWEFYQSLRTGAAGPRSLRLHRGDRAFAFASEENGTSGGDRIEILSPTPDLVSWCNANDKMNDISYVLRVFHAGRKILLPGDIEQRGWGDLADTYGSLLKSDFLRASHHGRDSGYHLDSLKLINPLVAIVSVGRKPVTDASRKYSGQCNDVYSTRHYGDLELRIDDNGNPEFFSQRNAK